MYAQISARGRESKTFPKTMRVETRGDLIRFNAFPSVGKLRIRAECTDYYGSGMRGGDIRRVDRDFLMVLTKPEIELMLALMMHDDSIMELDLKGLKEIRSVDELRADLSNARKELQVAQAEIKRLHSKIARAKKALGES